MDKELIEHIAKTLKHDEVPYAEGAWERFLEKDKKKRAFVYWPIGSAAAIILVALGFIFSLNKVDEQTQNNEQKITSGKINVAPENDAAKENLGQTINQKTSNQVEITADNQKSNTTFRNERIDSNSDDQNKKSAPTINPLPINENPIVIANKQNVIAQVNQPNKSSIVVDSNNLKTAAVNTSITKAIDKTTEPVVESQKKSFEEVLERDTKAAEKVASTNKKTTTKDKWETGLFVGPAMGNDNKVKVNYGFSFSYALADKISINSGIAYNALSATESTDASRPQTLSDRSLAAVNANVRGISIPLEIKYKITDNFYSGVGVSALAVLNNRQENSYIFNDVQQVSYSDAGAFANKTIIVAQRTTEPAATTNDLDKYIGFYNFSLGYKQKLSKKTSFALEPFLRLPMKPLTNENLNLTNGGLKLMLGF